jgi:site-specific DNA-methyltransferase (adenine-specific)
MNLSQNPHLHKTDVSRSTLFWADCFDVFPSIPDKSVNLILADLPYGTTQNNWDNSVLPLDLLWQNYSRILSENGCVVLTADGIFTGILMMSNPKWFKYKMIWDKKSTTGFLNAKKMPLRRHEDILIFAKGKTTYNPIMEERGKPRKKGGYVGGNKGTYGSHKEDIKFNNEYYPTSIIEISNANQKAKQHPTEKPLELMEWLIKTYSNEGEIVLDNTMGSGTTGWACLKTNRQFIGIEKEKQYYDIAVKRLLSICQNCNSDNCDNSHTNWKQCNDCSHIWVA